MNKLLPDQLKEIWGSVDAGQALTVPEEPRLKEALLSELAAYLGVPDVAVLEARCRSAATGFEKRVGKNRPRPRGAFRNRKVL